MVARLHERHPRRRPGLPECTSKALDLWAYENRVEHAFIRPGEPIENAFVESFNGRFRDECPNQHWFSTLADARRRIEAWRFDDNHVRSHSALGYLPPATFARGAGSGRIRRPPPRNRHCNSNSTSTPQSHFLAEGSHNPWY